jgi:16S rRNA processing protein RimM
MQVTIGKIINAWGVKGHLKVLSMSDFSTLRYQKGNQLMLVDDNKKTRVVTVSQYRKSNHFDIVLFNEISTRNEAIMLVGNYIYANKNDVKLDHNHFYYDDLLGCQVYDQDELLIGRVDKIESYASYKTLRIARDNNKDVLVPFVDFFIKKIDIDHKKIIINVIEGLL